MEILLNRIERLEEHLKGRNDSLLLKQNIAEMQQVVSEICQKRRIDQAALRQTAKYMDLKIENIAPRSAQLAVIHTIAAELDKMDHVISLVAESLPTISAGWMDDALAQKERVRVLVNNQLALLHAIVEQAAVVDALALNHARAGGQ
ncbi:hypothetical protein J8273_8637 [Carpediemonas membranifera]|uniref:Uncharacterized protein n=1 Tax=Carpediemonas membranifera TaxID=201153 RepID=A0A8J6E6V0_9EUKA|nr:hypothetical protein J8273_8637 [Carpediemonas membranifera]|eukprot:KAG9389950.1 hypothetical protein J8273_8637 [Carpediemonas membranifera]